MATIDKVCKEEANSYILFVPDIIKGLYRAFVSNKEQSYEDPIEE